MKYLLPALLVAALSFAVPVRAHFGVILPSDDIVSRDDSRTLTMQVKFMHPMERQFLEMTKPEQFGVSHAGQRTSLLETLQAAKDRGPDQDREFSYWTTDYRVRRPGDYTFYVAPAPYWEPAEDLYIQHYTKVCVNAFGLEQGWDEPLGLETEIIPLTRPYGLWTGNLFTGRILLKGRPVPFATVEVEYLNGGPGSVSMISVPAAAYLTQVVKADADGIFSYAMPKAGWWGFAALSEADRTLPYEGVQKPLEIGAVYWVQTRDMP